MESTLNPYQKDLEAARERFDFEHRAYALRHAGDRDKIRARLEQTLRDWLGNFCPSEWYEMTEDIPNAVQLIYDATKDQIQENLRVG